MNLNTTVILNRKFHIYGKEHQKNKGEDKDMNKIAVKKLFSGKKHKEMKEEFMKEGLGEKDIFQLESNILNYITMMLGSNYFDITDIPDSELPVPNKDYYHIQTILYCLNTFYEPNEVYYKEIQLLEGSYWVGDLKFDEESGKYIFDPTLDALYDEFFSITISGHEFHENEIHEQYEETDPELIRLRKVLSVIFEKPNLMEETFDAGTKLYAKSIYEEILKTNIIRFKLQKLTI